MEKKSVYEKIEQGAETAICVQAIGAAIAALREANVMIQAPSGRSETESKKVHRMITAGISLAQVARQLAVQDNFSEWF